MLQKAIREFGKMKTETPNTDSVFNFFVTAYHVMDYVKAKQAAPAAAIKTMQLDPDFRMCRFICNKGKHLMLKKNDHDTKSVRKRGALFGAATFNSTMFNEGPSHKFYVSDKEVDIIELGNKLIQKWEAFFVSNGI